MSASWSGKIYRASTQPGGGSGFYAWIDASAIPEPYEFRDETHGTLNVGSMRLERGPVGPGVFSNQITAAAGFEQAFQDINLPISFQRPPWTGATGGDIRRQSTFSIRFDHSKIYTYQEVFGGPAPVINPTVIPPTQPTPTISNVYCNIRWGAPVDSDLRGIRRPGQPSNYSMDIRGLRAGQVIHTRNTHIQSGWSPGYDTQYADNAGEVHLLNVQTIVPLDWASKTGDWKTEILDGSGRTGAVLAACASFVIVTDEVKTPAPTPAAGVGGGTGGGFAVPGAGVIGPTIDTSGRIPERRGCEEMGTCDMPYIPTTALTCTAGLILQPGGSCGLPPEMGSGGGTPSGGGGVPLPMPIPYTPPKSAFNWAYLVIGAIGLWILKES